MKSEVLLDAEAVEKEVAQLNETWAPWVYRIPRYKADYVSKTAADLLPKPEPDEAAAPKS